MAYKYDALIKIHLIEKEKGNSGCIRTIQLIPSYTTNNNTERQRE